MSHYDNNTLAAIHEALDDEYRARAVYAAVIERHGPVAPFTNIVVSEDRHAKALEGLLRRAGLPVPADRWAGNIPAPETLRDAYALGVKAEIDNHAMYDRLRRKTSAPEVLRVFDNLGSASHDNHLPAFQRQLDRLDGQPGAPDGGGRGQGNGGGRRRTAEAAGTGTATGMGTGMGRGGGYQIGRAHV